VGEVRHRHQLSRLALERDDLVAESPVARLLGHQPGIGVLPVELLEGKFRRGLPGFDLVALEHGVARERFLLALVVDAVYREAHAPIRPRPVAPGDGDHVVVRERHGVLHEIPPMEV